MKAVAIAATDTDAGKTVVAMALAAYWQRFQPGTWALFKPIQTGAGDRAVYEQVFDLDQPPETIAPLSFATPAAPPIAADREDRAIDLGTVWQAFGALRRSRDTVFVETLGGLGSPVTAELTVADLCAAWRLPTVLVVPVRLGAIAQAVANVALSRQMQVDLRGIILNCPTPEAESQQALWAPPDLIAALTQTPVLGTIPYLRELNVDALAKVASTLEIERLR